MNKESLLKLIADAGYNVGFGAKKHFASYDMIDKLPGVIGILSISVGVFALVMPDLSTQKVSAFVLVLGVVGLYISQHSGDKDKFSKSGEDLTDTYDKLKVLYYRVKNNSSEDVSDELQQLNGLLGAYRSQTMHNQLVLSDWYAHYKFFWQHQIEWVNEQKNFRFWRDKVPLSFTLTCVAVLIFWAYNTIPLFERCVIAISQLNK